MIVSAVQGAERSPAVQEYVRLIGESAQVVPAGQLTLDGHKVTCGNRPTVLDNKLNDYGAAYPGFLILNPTLLNKVSTPIKMWIFAHECGHQFRGAEEEQADCFAVERGRRLGWLTLKGLDEVCQFLADVKINKAHYAGTRRCQAMRECYAGLSGQ
jgi:hypothetical protein